VHDVGAGPAGLGSSAFVEAVENRWEVCTHARSSTNLGPMAESSWPGVQLAYVGLPRARCKGRAEHSGHGFLRIVCAALVAVQ
jgi:hypothetical protein